MGFRKGFGSRPKGLDLRVQGLRFRAQGSGYPQPQTPNLDLRLRVQDLIRVWSLALQTFFIMAESSKLRFVRFLP